MYAKELKLDYNICSDMEFERCRRYLDETMKRRTINGFQNPKRQASIVNEDMDIDLFQRNILGTDDPRKLLHNVCFLVGKFFALRSRQEHRNLSAGVEAQIKVEGMNDNDRVP